ncbi:MAG TPA: hypothetical protein PLU30_01820 [Verrucomicrobiae bacterium]|nr:hypothetical protein [Verrucomicrobiae bacterium]
MFGSTHALAPVALAIALVPWVATAQGISKYADPSWNPNLETNKVSNLAGKSFTGTASKMAGRSARLADGDVKMKSFKVKQWSSPEATGLKEHAARLPATDPMPLKSSPYAGKGFKPARTGDMSKLQKNYPAETSKFSGQTARGLDTDTATKAYQGKSVKDLQTTVDRTLTQPNALSVDDVKKLLNKPGSSLEPTAEAKPQEGSLPGQGIGGSTGGSGGMPTVGPAARTQGKSRHGISTGR